MQLKDAIDRRGRSRIDVGCTISYRIAGTADFFEGELGDLAEEGALMWIHHELDLGMEMFFLVDSTDPEETPTEFMATVVRINREKNSNGMFGYGCRIVCVGG